VSPMQHRILVAGPWNIGSEDLLARIAKDMSKSGITTLYRGLMDRQEEALNVQLRLIDGSRATKRGGD